VSYLDIRLQAQDKLVYSLRDFAGKKVVLFFYPKDMTEGCTIEARDFTRFKEDFAKKGYTIIGVSRDSVESHCKFVEKEELEILLLSDVNEELVNAFEVLKQKNMYGKMVMGIERSTFILDQEGNIVQELRKVSAIGHVQSLLESL
jgi:peroxiredoxin Q/BCP